MEAEESRDREEQQRRSVDLDAQRRLQHESHLNAIKLMLLDHAARGVSDPHAAIAGISVIMRGKDFRDNLKWFWDHVISNDLLMDAYFGEALSRLTSADVDSEAATEVFDHMPQEALDQLPHWLLRQESQSPWCRVVEPLLTNYYDTLESRRTETQRIEAERQRRVEEERARRKVEEQVQREARQIQARMWEHKQIQMKRVRTAIKLLFPLSVLFAFAVLWVYPTESGDSWWENRKSEFWVLVFSWGAFWIIGLPLLRWIGRGLSDSEFLQAQHEKD